MAGPESNGAPHATARDFRFAITATSEKGNVEIDRLRTPNSGSNESVGITADSLASFWGASKVASIAAIP